MNRFNVIDVTKGIGILLVVFAHVYYGHDALVLIYSFHMPLFFIVSGLLFRKEKNPEFLPFLKKRAKRLLVPYVIYEAVSIVCLYLSERVYPGVFDVSKAKYIEYFRQILVSNWSGTHVNQPLWFLPCLFLVEMVYYFLAKMKDKSIVLVCVLLAWCGWVLESGHLDFDNKLLPWNLDSGLFALGFYAFGNLYAREILGSIEKIDTSKYKPLVCIGIVAVLTVIWYPLAVMNDKITLGTKILNNGFLLYLTGILGTCMIMTVSILLKNSRFLAYCGRNSFEIMASHYLFRVCLVRPAYIVLLGAAYKRKVFREAFVPFLIVLSLSLMYTVLYTQVRKHCRKKVRQAAEV